MLAVARTGHGRISHLSVLPMPDEIQLLLRGGCTDAVLPATYWTKGWNAALWGDDIMNLLAFCAAPIQPLLAHFALNGGRLMRAGLTTRIPDDSVLSGGFDPEDPTIPRTIFLDPGGDQYVHRGDYASFLSASKRSQQFGIHDNRYTKIADLVDFRVLRQRTFGALPNWAERSRLLAAGIPEGSSAVIATQGTARAYSIEETTLGENARRRMLEALQRSKPPTSWEIDEWLDSFSG